MGNSTSIKHKYSSEEINKLTRETGFTLGQLDNLHHRFEKLDINKNGYLEREDLLLLPELNVNPLSDRIIHAFFSENLTVKESQKLRFQVMHKNVCIVVLHLHCRILLMSLLTSCQFQRNPKIIWTAKEKSSSFPSRCMTLMEMVKFRRWHHQICGANNHFQSRMSWWQF